MMLLIFFTVRTDAYFSIWGLLVSPSVGILTSTIPSSIIEQRLDGLADLAPVMSRARGSR
ncbi:hypothetical protein ACRQ5Q_42930 (plasmid) [Bradyrhizobium sp. PMVTL-01]|uniref:hypothetical protein n=1 Tax=Bradyrhizobium sp. PMVTL-01 TaxID=3434999 RepID=UPI003F72AE82